MRAKATSKLKISYCCCRIKVNMYTMACSVFVLWCDIHLYGYEREFVTRNEIGLVSYTHIVRRISFVHAHRTNFYGAFDVFHLPFHDCHSAMKRTH